jgi:hypothetical protein
MGLEAIVRSARSGSLRQIVGLAQEQKPGPRQYQGRFEIESDRAAPPGRTKIAQLNTNE